MTRSQRRAHLIAWLIIAAALPVLLALALGGAR